MFPLDIRTQTKLEDVLLLARMGYTLESSMKALQVDQEYTMVLEYELSFDEKPECGFTVIGWMFGREYRQKLFRALMEKLKNLKDEQIREYALEQIKRIDSAGIYKHDKETQK